MFDLVIKNAKELKGPSFEIGVVNGKISQIAPKITGESKETLTLTSQQYLSAGWIDDHVHCFEEMTLYYDYPDKIGVEKGVTTVIDAGTTGAENIATFYRYAKQAKTNVYALLNISKWGIVTQDELADLSKVQEALVKNKINELPEFIVGIKARMSKTVVGKNGITPLDLAKKIQNENQHLPLMVHIGSAPPELADVLARMEKGDVLTHCFNGKSNGILDSETNEIKRIAKEAFAKGIIFDIGHGTDSFNFHVAEVAQQANIKASSISTDIYIRNRENGPVYDLATTMEKLHVIGYSWEEIIEKVTKIPAENFHLANKGQLKEKFDADLTIFEFLEEPKVLTDSNGFTRTTNSQIKPVKTIIGGEIYDCQL
ncbi:amidohydrolase/deacetylase family metallohydrolase [Enterococcus sp. DIV0660C]|uniref:amidohydrolase/deacetylase family metallohydrolase n=1 Tax=Enterococcus sp. DIV0660C TaxID=2230880 RepID=UPI001A8E64C3|nr:amidohydrolase/deacetylase family metallohydrolase [Enterococcus sp. DIV0660C]MBO0430732.1 amidohydrolase/deacetylase family metallohydrolase [Enterococcus sp. DIV0660C]